MRPYEASASSPDNPATTLKYKDHGAELPSTDHEFGIHASGPAADTTTARLISSVKAWNEHRHDRYGRLSGDAFAWYPSGTTSPPPDGRPKSVFRKVTGRLVITWPPARPGAQPADRAD
jgi:hypothetical protein